MKKNLEQSFLIDSLVDDDDDLPAGLVIPISTSRLNANRENASKSTGAITPEGKAKVAQNSTTHGLTGKFRVLAAEVQSDFDNLLESLLSSYTPADAAESELVASMAQALWLSRRAIRLQDHCLELADSDQQEEAKAARQDLALYMRYQTTHERSYQRHAADLRKLQSDRQKAEIGFVSQKHREADQQRKQEKHEQGAALTKSRLDHQELRNRMLFCKVRVEEQFEKGRVRDRFYDR